MPIVQESVQVCQEVQSILNIVVGLVSDAKAGKSPAAIVADAVPNLISALTGIGGLALEISNGPAVDNTVALNMVALKQALLPGVV